MEAVENKISELYYFDRRNILAADVSKKYSEYLSAKIALREFVKKYSYQIMQEKYEQFIGKKVVIHYKDRLGMDNKTEIGYIKEFKWLQGDSRYDDGLYPFMYKVKKDGSMSNASFPLVDNVKAEVQKITRIEIIGDENV